MTDTVDELRCLAWQPAPHVIGARGHNHHCQLEHDHADNHLCQVRGHSWR